MIEPLLAAERALVAGQLDRAEQLYRDVATGDPRNSIAVVGLARVAIERGDEQGALDLARRALATDPANAAARRLVDRLLEIRRYRGEDAGEPAEPAEASEPAEPGEPAEPARSAGPTGPARARKRSILDRLRRRP